MAQLRGNRAEEAEEKPRGQGQLKCCRVGVRTRKREALERKALEPVRSRVLSRKDGHTLLRKRPPSLEEGYPKCSVEWLPLQLSLSNSSAGGRNNSQGSEQTVQGVASVASNQPSAESYSGPI